nr:RICIN domain-containing protein [Streptomyces cavernae]
MARHSSISPSWPDRHSPCLDAYDGQTILGTKVILWDCNGDTNQQWNVNADGTVRIVNSGLCLDAYDAGTANGTKMILWVCNGDPNQKWTLK